ncbi:hypothetical protein L3Q82_002859 [Scortum barcoo]|uniref:Uncharacterized protein n=1 Tax=Scortum barcoo TaxID=214431 RepID=A0ACB8VV28_9TELE|nr:hypothetical protein L3Q82_002859 [Scortum barcoo]
MNSQKTNKDRYIVPRELANYQGPRPHPGASQAWGWGSQPGGERLVARPGLGLCPPGPAFGPTGPGRAQPEMATWARLPVGSPPAGRSMRGRCNVVWVAVVAVVAGGLDTTQPSPWTKTLAIGTWNVTSLGGKEPELVQEVERRYRTQFLERGWTLHYSGVAQGERRASWCGLAYSSLSSAQPQCVGVHPGEQERASLTPSGQG